MANPGLDPVNADSVGECGRRQREALATPTLDVLAEVPAPDLEGTIAARAGDARLRLDEVDLLTATAACGLPEVFRRDAVFATTVGADDP